MPEPPAPAPTSLDAYLRPLPVVATFQDTWLGVALAFRVLLASNPPPIEWVGSVRAIVVRERQVLVVAEPEGPSIVVGGRPEPGETIESALVREVAEETGWAVRVGPLIAIVHAHHKAGALPPGWRRPNPDFLDLIYVADATRFVPAQRVDGQPCAFRAIGETLALFSDVRHFLVERAVAALSAPESWPPG